MKSIFIVLGLLFSIPIIAQNLFPEAGPIYNDEVVPRIDITLPADSLAIILAPGNEESDYHFHATFDFDNGTIQETIENIGFRLRGNTSRYAQKKSFKVSFNTYESGRKWYGVEKLNLNGEHNDPSVSRSKMCWDLLQDIGVPAPRANHIQLYINGEYFGLYTNIEHIDEEFVGMRFGNKNGNLYKCLWPADLNYLGNDPDLYKLINGNRRTYDLKTNEELDDYSDLAHFIDILNNTPTEALRCELEGIFNIHTFLPAMAFDILSGNWDGPLFNKNNFYLYHNEQTGLFEYIPYDLDNTFGIDWFQVDWSLRNIYQWANTNEPRPLYWRIIEVPEYKDRLSFFMHQIINDYYTEDLLHSKADELHDLIETYVMDDPYYPLNYAFSMQDFENSFVEGLPYFHTPFGLKQFISLRRASTIDQLELNDIPAIIREVKTNRPTIVNDVYVVAEIEDDYMDFTAQLCYTVNPTADLECIDMYDDGTHEDGEAGDGIYGAIIPAIGEPTTIEYSIRVQDTNGNLSMEPACGTNFVEVRDIVLTLAINEFMASNDTTIADEFGEFDDWVEIYNYGEEAISLNGLYLSDDLDEPTRWAFPDTTIQADAYLLIWVDDDEEQGPFHTTYNLSAGGEYIGIFDTDEMSNQLIDGLEFGVQQTDVSFGRLPNGTGIFQTLTPTPGYSNESISSVGELEVKVNYQLYPNPTDGLIFLQNEHVFSKPKRVIIINTYGQSVVDQWWDGSKALNLGGYPAGVYFVFIKENQQQILIDKIIKQ